MPRDPLAELYDRLMDRMEETVADSVDNILADLEEVVFNQTRKLAKEQGIGSKATSPRRQGKGQHRTTAKVPPAINYYEVLEVSRAASTETIEAAYKSLAKRFHPDVNRDPKAQERMRSVNMAWEVLKDAKKRKEYDKKL